MTHTQTETGAETMTTIEKVRTRMMDELGELETLTASAPDDHPARIALRKIRDHLETCENPIWYETHDSISVGTLTAKVDKDTALGFGSHKTGLYAD